MLHQFVAGVLPTTPVLIILDTPVGSTLSVDNFCTPVHYRV